MNGITQPIHQMAKDIGPRTLAIIWWTAVGAVLSTVCGYVPFAHALDPIPAQISSGLQAGVVTSVEQHSLSINGKQYTVDPEIEIRDQEDNVLQPDVIKRDYEVKFHLKKGEGNTIDVLIVYMPQ